MGAPIYLVSACTSGEEFIAAFRRYADKNGLFIPIAEPLPPGRRHRFAVTLRDGGVMIEGEAEIVSAARMPSVLHGRIGMTLKFVEPDDPSRTTLGELERARLSMRPPPPSVPPRPAELPAEPRPLPPPAQGRIDAVNALAECVAIGDVAALGPPLPPVATPPRAGQRFAAPTTPPAGRAGPATSPPGALGVAPRTPTGPRAASGPLPIALAEAAARDADPPSVTPRATPQPDRLRDAERAAAPSPRRPPSPPASPIAPGPSSETMFAAMPPAPSAPPRAPSPVDRFDQGPISSTMNAVPVATTHPSSAPTEIGGLLVVPIDPEEEASGRTQVHAGAPRPVRSTPAPPIAAATPAAAAANATEPQPRFVPAATTIGTDPRPRAVQPAAAAVTEQQPRPPFLQAATIIGTEPRPQPAPAATNATEPQPPSAPAATVHLTEPQLQPRFVQAATIVGTDPRPQLAPAATVIGTDPRPQLAPAASAGEPQLQSAPAAPGSVAEPQPQPRFVPAATIIGTEPQSAAAAGASEPQPRSAQSPPAALTEPPPLPRFMQAATVTITEPQRPGFLPAVTVSGVAPVLRPPAPPLHGDVEIAEPTDISMPPDLPSSPSGALAAELPPAAVPGTAGDEPAVAADAEATSPPVALDDAVPEADAHDLAGEGDSETEPGASASKPRRTVLGVAVVPSGPSDELVPPAPAMLRGPAMPADPEEATSHARIPATAEEATTHARIPATAEEATTLARIPTPGGQGAGSHAARPPLDSLRIPVEEPTLHVHWDPVAGDAAATMQHEARAAEPHGAADSATLDTATAGDDAAPSAPDGVSPTEPSAPAVPAPSSNLPSGDWTIALDPEAPGGWSPPYQALGAVKTPPMSPLAITASPPADSPPVMSGLPGEVPVIDPVEPLEPKVQIDPTLVHAIQAPGQAPASPSAAHDAQRMHEAPALHMMMAVPQPGPYAPHPGHAMHGQGAGMPGYAIDPSYPPMPGAMRPGLTPDGSGFGDGFGDVRYPTVPSHGPRRGVIILLVTAVVAVLIGIAAMLVFRGRPGPTSPPPAEHAATSPPVNPATSPPGTTSPPGETATAPTPAAPGGSAPTSPTTPTAPDEGSAATQSATAPPPAAPPAGDCYADVTSQPAGADIVLDQETVVGTTPKRVSLPCGRPVELLVRKARLVPATHTITPTPAGTAVQFVLVRQTFLVKVSSNPPGATVTLGGKSLGVTPTMIKVPAFESSTLSIAKDGYETETEKVAPRTNGTAVHSVLKKSDRKKPR